MFDFIVNPVSGGGKSLENLEVFKKIFDNANAEYSIHYTKKKCDAIEKIKELTSSGEEKKIIVFGGDGTFNEAINGIVDFDKTTIGLIPSGTGNDYVKATKLEKDPEKAAQLILQDKTGYTDYIDLGNKRCLNVAGGGMDTDTLVQYESMKCFKGKIKYYIALLIVLIRLKFHKLILTIDDNEPIEREAFMIGVGNGKYIGGGMPICPTAVTDDGILNVTLINSVKRRKVLGLLIRFLKGKILEEDITESFECKRAKIEILDNGYVQADGEISDEKVFDCKLVHGKLKIYR